MTDRMSDEHDKWFYDLGELAEVVETNRKIVEANRAQVRQTTRRLVVIASFVLFAFLALAYRLEVAQRQISEINARIQVTQQQSCRGGVEIVKRFNREQDALAEVVRAAPYIAASQKPSLIKTYQDARILPVPTCEATR